MIKFDTNLYIKEQERIKNNIKNQRKDNKLTFDQFFYLNQAIKRKNDPTLINPIRGIIFRRFIKITIK